MHTTQLLTAVSLTADKGLIEQQPYLFSFQIAEDGIVRVITTTDIEIFYPSIHDFLVSWSKITSLGWANDKATFEKMLQEIKSMARM